MAVGKLVEAGEDGCGGREKGQPLRALRFTRAPANPSAYGGVVAGGGGNGIASRRTLDLVCFFFPFLANKIVSFSNWSVPPEI
jgi:hypothetical protein